MVVIFLIAGMGGGEDVEQPSSIQGDSSVTNSGNSDESSSGKDIESSTAKDVSIAETELYNANGVIVTATEMKEGLFGPEVSVTVSNGSEKNIVVSTRDLSVNGYMLSASGLYSDVAAGKKSIETMTLMSSELSEAGIETVADMPLHTYDG